MSFFGWPKPEPGHVFQQVEENVFPVCQRVAGERRFQKAVNVIAREGEPFENLAGGTSHVSKGKVLISIVPGGPDMGEFWRRVTFFSTI